jgi:hypothetical protein
VPASRGPGIVGTFHKVSKDHLPLYLNEFLVTLQSPPTRRFPTVSWQDAEDTPMAKRDPGAKLSKRARKRITHDPADREAFEELIRRLASPPKKHGS